MDENKEVNSTDPKREKVRVIPLSAIDDAPDHPFGVRDDEEMAELVESISTFGVINPVIVRKGDGERFELISGHRRKYACAKLGIDTLPVIVRDERLKGARPDAIAAVRVGDFYEFFDEDAEKVAGALELTMTSRSFPDGTRHPMCGFPFHKEENFFEKLNDKGTCKRKSKDHREDAA